ncbi:MAG TPA: putative Ig domain-containing protein [Bryobacteraceae bacterium]|nr:putative Ig domain-containing protein [Bryobacteraceae bacterium]
MKRFLAATLLLAATLHAQAIRTNAGFSKNSLAANDDGSTGLVALGFELNFFGRTRTHAFVNNNGNITFDAALATYTPFGLTGTRREIIAAFFADVDTRGAGSRLVTYGTDTIDGRRAFGVNYIDVGYYAIHADKTNAFQLIVIDRSETGAGNFDIEFNYRRIAWETGDASGGTNGFGGVPASVGWSNGSGDEGTSFELEGSLLPGALLDGGRRALNRNRLASTVPGRYIFRARNGVVLPPLSISTGCPLPAAFVGTPYTQTLNAVGANAYRWEMVADPGSALPSGISLSTNGRMTGTPSAVGTSEFTLRVVATTEDGEQTVSKRCALTVRPPTVTITSACPLPSGTVGQNYSRSVQATGGRAPYTWSLAEGSASLPVGLSLLPSGSIQGVPRVAGTTVVTLRATSNPGDNAEPALRSCSITINAEPLQLTSGCSLPPTTVGVPYSQALTVAGGAAPYVWTALGSMPPGLSLSPDGLVSGAASSTAGVFQVRVRDARGNVSEQTCTLQVSQPSIRISTACPLPTATTGRPYTFRLEASGGSGPYSWSSIGGMPFGLSLSGDGVVSGNPGGSGLVGMRFLVTDSTGNSAASGCNMVVMPSDFNITSCPLPAASVGVDYQQSLRSSGGSGTYLYTAVSGLPAGLTLNTNGLLSGRPREAGTGMLTVRVVDSQGRAATQPCSLPVNPSPLTIHGNCPLPTAHVGIAYSQRFEATGGVAPYRYRVDGTLPPGLELSSDGVLRGTPLAARQSEFEIEAMDAKGYSVPLACSIRTSVPEMPSLRLGAFAATMPAASNGPVVSLELDRPYALPIQGEFVITSEADTGSFEPTIDRPDPRVRFANGLQTMAFTIPANTTRISAPVVSTGTVAALITVRAMNLKVSGVNILTAPAPRQFRVARSLPVMTDACLGTSSSGAELRITGYTTTRSLDRAEFTYTAGAQDRTASVDVSGSAMEYFQSDEAVRNGGAFTLSVPLTLAGPGTLEPKSVTLSNSVGTTAARNVSTCR